MIPPAYILMLSLMEFGCLSGLPDLLIRVQFAGGMWGREGTRHGSPVIPMTCARVIGGFRCPGAAGLPGFTWANKGQPNEQDLADARAFAKGLVAG